MKSSLIRLKNVINQNSSGPTGIVMMNMGGPATLNDVHSFLSNLFHDKDLIPLPFQKLLAPRIASKRTPKIKEQYAAIGGGSPILKWTEIQGEGMAKLLDELSPHTAPHKPYVAFRYVNPLTADTLEQMKKDGVKRAVAFTQYPQYSCSTTGSSLNELYKQIKTTDTDIQWSVIDRWPTHPGLVKAFAQNIHQALQRFDQDERKHVPILFSAHSLPMSIVNRGDPYPAEVASTVQSVVSLLPQLTGHANPHRLVWQSQVGPSAWLGQQTSDAIQGLRKLGYKKAIVVPIAFTSDHIETLFELDLENAEEAHEIGLRLERAPSLNDSPTFIRAIADLAAAHLHNVYPSNQSTTEIQDTGYVGGWESGKPTSTQFKMRCPGCTNEVCLKQKDYFNGENAI
ncbi:ferrochelatase [Wallemia mellicola]|uniref:Ferrochelatase n=2 Tax=Wallemia mellicola TaxID=1708541 RepID=A0A4T0PVI0_9BASI|nr:ferrochelatase [Wallemia mellicola CBS 633.66]TIB74034.1 hypothetical protein E3Q24_00794 [Wallemia mellicola]EIM20938.1 ferrochelatase [Wallemia mellicola CBS 633.66]TIB77977.1 hypothetical protein E3Q23_01032 [Wallemia mellicola]TIB81673.1 ferrochelatase [Wallemia mellicola]TIB90920.1 ferrochelatase [Wallemia mellicola]|eukprot:XP_006958932.1 ferrochelatase [Wallemia mellicola CBS 633.66]